jgi:hypothetical protein
MKVEIESSNDLEKNSNLPHQELCTVYEENLRAFLKTSIYSPYLLVNV